jgi:hypothetical protein
LQYRIDNVRRGLLALGELLIVLICLENIIEDKLHVFQGGFVLRHSNGSLTMVSAGLG